MFTIAELPILNAPGPVHVSTPGLFSTRVSVTPTVDVVLNTNPPFAFVTPVPRIVPRFHVNDPVTVSVSVPVSVPFECV